MDTTEVNRYQTGRVGQPFRRGKREYTLAVATDAVSTG